MRTGQHIAPIAALGVDAHLQIAEQLRRSLDLVKDQGCARALEKTPRVFDRKRARVGRFEILVGITLEGLALFSAYYTGAGGWSRPSNDIASYRTGTPGQELDKTPRRTIRVRTDQPLCVRGRFDRRTESAAGHNQKSITSGFCNSSIEFTPSAGQKYRVIYGYDGTKRGLSLAQKRPDGNCAAANAQAKAGPICRTAAN